MELMTAVIIESLTLFLCLEMSFFFSLYFLLQAGCLVLGCEDFKVIRYLVTLMEI